MRIHDVAAGLLVAAIQVIVTSASWFLKLELSILTVRRMKSLLWPFVIVVFEILFDHIYSQVWDCSMRVCISPLLSTFDFPLQIF